MPELNQPGPWLSKYPLPLRAEVVTVTRDMAGDWLDQRTRPGTDHQRKLSAAKVNNYAAIMRAGRWRLNPQGFIADTEGWFFNGQHRLQALRNSGLEELDFWVFPDEPADLYSVIDTPHVRQARQLYTGDYATQVTSAVRYLAPGALGIYVTSMPPASVLDEVAKWPELGTHARLVHAAHMRARIPASAHLAVLAQAERTEYRDMIPAWLTGITTGFDLPTGDPRALLRNHYQGVRGRTNPELNYNLTAKAWNAYTGGERLQTLRWAITENKPLIRGFKTTEEQS